MTVADTSRKAGPFDGNGVTTNFPFDFKVFAKTDLAVVRTNEIGIETDLVLDSDYTVVLNADQDATPGGTVSYVGPPLLPIGWKLTILGATPYDQVTDITNVGRFNPNVIEQTLDRLVMQTQQLVEESERSVKVPVSSTTNPKDLIQEIIGAAAETIEARDQVVAIAEQFGDVEHAIEAATQQAELAEGYKEAAALSASSAADDAQQAEDAAAGALAAAGAQRIYETWAQLQAVAGAAGQGGQVINDPGVHLDPVTATTVANQGQYVWDVGASAWKWVRADVMTVKADRSELNMLRAIVPRTDALYRHVVIARNSATGVIKLIYARNDSGEEVSMPTESVMKTMLGSQLFTDAAGGEQLVLPRTDELMMTAILFRRDGVLYVNRYETDDGQLIQPTEETAGGTQSAAIDGHIGYGQSNVVTSSGTAPIVSTAPSAHGRNNLMLSPALSGPRTFTRFIGGVTDYTVEPVEYWTGLVPSYESGTSPVQSRWPTLGDKYLDVMDRHGETRARMLVTATGIGSTSLADLSPPNTVYTTALLNNVKACADLAAMEGLRYLLRFLHWDQGEADALTPEATYRAALVSLLEAFQIDAAAITGQRPRSIRMGMVQILAGGRVGPAMATLRLHEQDPRFVMFGPRYQFVYPDTVHLDATGQACVGEMIGKGCALMDITGQKFDALRPLSFTQNGADLRIAFNNDVNGSETHPGPVGPLVIDDSFYVLTGAGGHRGMSFVGNTNQVTGIGLDGDDAVVVSMNAAPAPGAILDLGLGTSAGWRVRDSDDRWTYAANALPIFNHSAATRHVFS